MGEKENARSLSCAVVFGTALIWVLFPVVYSNEAVEIPRIRKPRATIEAESLYSSDDQVLLLDQSSFNRSIFNQSKAFFVQFYSSSCGHCQQFAKTFKQFAKSVQNWSRIVQLAVVNCVDDRNAQICSSHSIKSYPTLKYFKYNSRTASDGIKYKGKKSSLTNLQLAELVASDWKDQKPVGWPDLDDTTGSTSRSADLVEKLNDFVKNDPKSVQTDEKTEKEVKKSTEAPVADINPFQVHVQDLISALTYMLENEIPRRQLIDGQQMTALKRFVQLLAKYLPESIPRPVRDLLDRLNEWLLTMKTDNVTAEEWTRKINETANDLGNPLPSHITWAGCRGSQPRFRGYTCGLWTLFHVITVSAYKNDGSKEKFRPVDILEPIHGFVKYFMSCEDCSKHFDEMAQRKGLAKVKRAEDAVLWLWNAHNDVNERLKGSATEDPSAPKQQFPPASLCPKCHSLANGNTFTESAVLRFMLAYYSTLEKKNDTKNEQKVELNSI